MRPRRVLTLSLFTLLTLSGLILAGCGGQPAAAPTQAAAAQPTVPAAAAPTQAAAAQPTAPAAAVPPPTAAIATAAPEPTKLPAPKPTEPAAPTAAVTTAAPQPTAAPAPTEAPTEAAPTGSDALDLLTNALKAQLTQKAWRTTTTVDDGGKVTTNVVEFVAPDSLHMTMSGGAEVIALKEGSYQKDTNGAWKKLPMDMSAIMAGLLDPDSVQELMAGVTVDKLKFIGPDLVNGKAMWVYQYVTKTKLSEQQTIESTAKLWIGMLDKLPYRGESEGNSVMNPGGKTKSTVIYEYDPNIKIEAPIK